jgi:hypothetical protein
MIKTRSGEERGELREVGFLPADRPAPDSSPEICPLNWANSLPLFPSAQSCRAAVGGGVRRAGNMYILARLARPTAGAGYCRDVSAEAACESMQKRC